MKYATMVKVYDLAGNLTRLEFYDKDDKHIVQAEWSEGEPQTPRNQTNFIDWADKYLSSKGYTVIAAGADEQNLLNLKGVNHGQ